MAARSGSPPTWSKVWEVVGRAALKTILGADEARAGNGLAGPLEEDARLTALFLWTIQATIEEDDRMTERSARAETSATGDPRPVIGGKGFSLPFDVARRFAQPLGIDLRKWEKRTIETAKGMVRLLPVSAREPQLFAARRASWPAPQLHEPVATDHFVQLRLFGNPRDSAPDRKGPAPSADTEGPSPIALSAPDAATTLDRIHAAMLLQKRGHTYALRTLFTDERERGPDFLRLANALSALYPRGSEEKRLLDAMLLMAPK